MSTPLAIRIVVWIWLIAAVAVGRQGWLRAWPAFTIPVIIVGLTALLAFAYRGFRSFRAWVDALDMRGLVLLHATRFVGFYFLVQYDRGELPYSFAVPGGIGGIIVAALALAVCFFPLNPSLRRRAIAVWNVVGFIELLLTLLTAARLGLADRGSMHALRQLPLSLLPTFLVPLLLATHLAIYTRLKGAEVAAPR